MNTKTTSVSLLCGYILVSFPGHCTVSHAQTILRESGVLSDISCYVEYSQLQSQIRRKHSYNRLQKSCNRQVEQWKTTIDLLHMNLIIFPSTACPSSWFKHSKTIVVFHSSACLLQDFCNPLYLLNALITSSHICY